MLGLGLALLLTEGLTRVIFRRSMDFDMEMWKYATQIKAVSDDPVVGYEHRPDAQAFLMGTEITTNSQGLRGDEISMQKPPGTYRVAVIGDSITLGWGVEADETYPARLEDLLNASPPDGFPEDAQYEVLNLGVGNYNTVQEVRRLRSVGLPFEPDLIVLGYFINDAEPTPQVHEGYLIEHSYLYAFTLSRLRTLDFGGVDALTYEDYYAGLYADGQAGWKASQAGLAELAALGAQQDIPVAMFIIPELHNLSDDYPFQDIHGRLVRAGEDAGLPVVDLYPAFAGHTPEQSLWVSPTDAHHNAEAQAMIAQGIYDALDAGLVEP